MENFRFDLVEDLDVFAEEYDEFYEDLEAPKFVDFSAPDTFRPDDRSWFCARIGCDQNHEDIDPDALLRKFKLRVMAARSPNVRLRKTLDRNAPSLIPKCPQSAPAKPAKSRTLKLTAMTSITESSSKNKLKDHPISSLRSTPKQTKAALPYSTNERALTTPRSKKSNTVQDSFRSAKCQKTPVEVPKSINVAKVLFCEKEKEKEKEASDRTGSMKYDTAVSEVCDGMKKLKIRGRKRQVPSRYLGISNNTRNPKRTEGTLETIKKAEEATKLGKKRTVVCLKTHNPTVLREISSNNSCDTDGKSSNTVTTDISDVPSSQSSETVLGNESLQTTSVTSAGSSESATTDNSKQIMEKKISIHGTERRKAASQSKAKANAANFNEDKENVACTGIRHMTTNFTNCTTENLPPLPSKKVSKAIKHQSKLLKETSDQGGKLKRTTNPKPFRLRTDERQTLKVEANMEKKLLFEAKDTEYLVRHGEKTKLVSKQSQLKDNRVYSGPKATDLKPRIPVEKAERNIQNYKSVMGKEKKEEEFHNENLNMKSSKGRKLWIKPTVSQIRRENCQIPIPAIAPKEPLKTRRPSIAPKDSSFLKTHEAKGCQKRIVAV